MGRHRGWGSLGAVRGRLSTRTQSRCRQLFPIFGSIFQCRGKASIDRPAEKHAIYRKWHYRCHASACSPELIESVHTGSRARDRAHSGQAGCGVLLCKCTELLSVSAPYEHKVVCKSTLGRGNA